MTTKDFKRLVHERRAKTGESYSIARMHVLRAAAGSPTPAAAPGTGTTEPAAAPPIVGLPAVAVWTHEWLFDGKDIAHDILTSLYDDLVDQVHSDEYPVGYTDFEELVFRNIDEETGTAEFHVEFTAEHPSEGPEFNGHVEGELAFDTALDEDEEWDELDDQSKKDAFLESLRLTHAEVHFHMGDPD